MNAQELSEILKLHKKWLFNMDGGKRADLSSADLSSADLRFADLRYADLCFANLCSADLRSANLRSANLCFADLRSADLRFANLCFADLRSADLSSADLRSADLRSADLRSADLRYADLNKKIIQVSRIGSRKGITTYIFEDDVIFCGCFKGSLKEFKEKVLETYPDGEYNKEYIGFINYLESLK